MNVHGHMQFLYMEPTVAESSAVQQSTINSSSQEREIQKNNLRKRQRRTECPVCLKTYARRDTLRVRKSTNINRGVNLMSILYIEKKHLAT